MMNNTQSPLTPTECILDWNAARQNQDEIASLLDKAGNYFLLDHKQISALGKKLHLYLGADNEILYMYAVPANEDTKNLTQVEINKLAIPISLKTNAEPLPTKNYTGPQGEKAIVLIESINAWNETAPKAAWLTKIWEDKIVPLAIEIDCSDFNSGDNHACFFALRKGENGYMMDLVIINVGKDIAFNPKENGDGFGGNLVFRDMARPVPPFGQEGHPSTDKDNFGILFALEII